MEYLLHDLFQNESEESEFPIVIAVCCMSVSLVIMP